MTNDTDNQKSSEGGHPVLWSISAILLFILIAVSGYKYREMMLNSIIATAPLNTACMLNTGTCTTTLPEGGSVSFSINPHPIVAVSPLQLSLQLEGIEAQGVEVHFSGESMNMGLSQFSLTKQSEYNYNGEGILPVCVRNSMIWIADVQVATAQGKISFPFRFESTRP